MSKRRNVRKRAFSEEAEDDSADETNAREQLEATKALQRARQRMQGVQSSQLAGTPNLDKETVDKEEEIIGGYVKEQKKDDESNIDAEKERYIQEQLDKRLGRLKEEQPLQKRKSDKEELYAIPKALRTQKVEQEDVAAWMTGIVEVPLSVKEQMKNIEATELAKKRLLNERGSGDLALDSKAQQEELRRISYPLRFGKQTNKEEEWRQEVLQRDRVPKEWKRKERA